MQPLAPESPPPLADIDAVIYDIHEQMERLKTNDNQHGADICSLTESCVDLKHKMGDIEERLALIDTRSAGSIDAIQGLSRRISDLVQHVDRLKPPATLSPAAFCPPPVSLITTDLFTSTNGENFVWGLQLVYAHLSIISGGWAIDIGWIGRIFYLFEGECWSIVSGIKRQWVFR
jgi:hypothetical protein